MRVRPEIEEMLGVDRRERVDAVRVIVDGADREERVVRVDHLPREQLRE